MTIDSTRRALSVRLPPPLMRAYSELIEEAGLTLSEHIRNYLEELTQRAAALEAERPEIRVSFAWRDASNTPYPENLGTVSVHVSPPPGITEEELDRLIFISPEFFNEDGREQFRIDSYYFHRVADSHKLIESSRARRCVLSYVTIGGRWHAGVFRYDDNVSLRGMAVSVEAAVAKQIAATIRLYQLGVLPSNRLLDAEQLADRRESLGKIQLPDEASFVTVSS